MSDAIDYRSGGYGGGLSGGLTDVQRFEELQYRLDIVLKNPLLAQDPNLAYQLAQSDYSTWELARQSNALYAQSQFARFHDNLLNQSKANQRVVWNSITESQRQALAGMGYSPPSDGGGGGGGFNPLNPLAVAGKVVGMGLRVVNTTLHAPGIKQGLDLLTWIGDQPAHLYRALKIMEDGDPLLQLLGAGVGLGVATAGLLAAPATGGASLGVTALALGGGALLGATGAQAVVHPTQWWDAYNSSWNGEKVWTPAAQRRADEILADERLLSVVKGIAWQGDLGGLVEHMASRRDATNVSVMQQAVLDYAKQAVDETDPKYRELVDKLYQVIDIPEVKQAIRELQQGKVSFGRDVARSVGLRPGDRGYGLLSGALDATWIITMDPTLLAGRLFMAHRARRDSVRLLDDAGRQLERVDVVNQIRLKAAQDPAKQAALEHVVEAVNRDDARYLVTHVPAYLGVWENLRGYAAELGRAGKTFTVEDFYTFLDEQNGLSHMLSGQGVRPGFDDLMLPRWGFTIGQTVIPTPVIKEQLGRVVNLLDDSGSLAAMRRNMAEGVNAAREASDIVTVMSHQGRSAMEVWTKPELAQEVEKFDQVMQKLWVVNYPLRKLGQLMGSLGSMLPMRDVVDFAGGPRWADDVRRFVGMGRAAGMTSDQRRFWLNTALNATSEAQRKEVLSSFLEAMVIQAGGRSNARLSQYMDDFVLRVRHNYGVTEGARTVLNNRTVARGIQDGQTSKFMPIPDLIQLQRMARKGALMQLIVPISDSRFVTSVYGVWKPAVLMRIGFIPRALGEELLAHLARAGVGGYFGQFGARSIADEMLYDEYLARARRGLVDGTGWTQKDIEILSRKKYVSHIRPFVSIHQALRGNPSEIEWARRYSVWMRSKLTHGVAPGVTGQIHPKLQNAVVGSPNSFRRMVLTGADPHLIENMQLFQGRFAKPILDELSARNMSFVHIVDNPDSGLERITVKQRDSVTGEVRDVDMRIDRSNPMLYGPDDPGWSKMVHDQASDTVAQPVQGPAVVDTLMWSPPVGLHGRTEEIDRFRGIFHAIAGREWSSLFSMMMLGPSKSQWSAYVRQLGHKNRDLYDAVRGGLMRHPTPEAAAEWIWRRRRKLKINDETARKLGDMVEWARAMKEEEAAFVVSHFWYTNGRMTNRADDLPNIWHPTMPTPDPGSIPLPLGDRLIPADELPVGFMGTSSSGAGFFPPPPVGSSAGPTRAPERFPYRDHYNIPSPWERPQYLATEGVDFEVLPDGSLRITSARSWETREASLDARGLERDDDRDPITSLADLDEPDRRLTPEQQRPIVLISDDAVSIDDIQVDATVVADRARWESYEYGEALFADGEELIVLPPGSWRRFTTEERQAYVDLWPSSERSRTNPDELSNLVERYVGVIDAEYAFIEKFVSDMTDGEVSFLDTDGPLWGIYRHAWTDDARRLWRDFRYSIAQSYADDPAVTRLRHLTGLPILPSEQLNIAREISQYQEGGFLQFMDELQRLKNMQVDGWDHALLRRYRDRVAEQEATEGVVHLGPPARFLDDGELAILQRRMRSSEAVAFDPDDPVGSYQIERLVREKRQEIDLLVNPDTTYVRGGESDMVRKELFAAEQARARGYDDVERAVLAGQGDAGPWLDYESAVLLDQWAAGLIPDVEMHPEWLRTLDELAGLEASILEFRQTAQRYWLGEADVLDAFGVPIPEDAVRLPRFFPGQHLLGDPREVPLRATSGGIWRTPGRTLADAPDEEAMRRGWLVRNEDLQNRTVAEIEAGMTPGWMPIIQADNEQWKAFLGDYYEPWQAAETHEEKVSILVEAYEEKAIEQWGYIHPDFDYRRMFDDVPPEELTPDYIIVDPDSEMVLEWADADVQSLLASAAEYTELMRSYGEALNRLGTDYGYWMSEFLTNLDEARAIRVQDLTSEIESTIEASRVGVSGFKFKPRKQLDEAGQRSLREIATQADELQTLFYLTRQWLKDPNAPQIYKFGQTYKPHHMKPDEVQRLKEQVDRNIVILLTQPQYNGAELLDTIHDLALSDEFAAFAAVVNKDPNLSDLDVEVADRFNPNTLAHWYRSQANPTNARMELAFAPIEDDVEQLELAIRQIDRIIADEMGDLYERRAEIAHERHYSSGPDDDSYEPLVSMDPIVRVLDARRARLQERVDALTGGKDVFERAAAAEVPFGGVNVVTHHHLNYHDTPPTGYGAPHLVGTGSGGSAPVGGGPPVGGPPSGGGATVVPPAAPEPASRWLLTRQDQDAHLGKRNRHALDQADNQYHLQSMGYNYTMADGTPVVDVLRKDATRVSVPMLSPDATAVLVNMIRQGGPTIKPELMRRIMGAQLADDEMEALNRLGTDVIEHFVDLIVARNAQDWEAIIDAAGGVGQLGNFPVAVMGLEHDDQTLALSKALEQALTGDEFASGYAGYMYGPRELQQGRPLDVRGIKRPLTTPYGEHAWEIQQPEVMAAQIEPAQGRLVRYPDGSTTIGASLSDAKDEHNRFFVDNVNDILRRSGPKKIVAQTDGYYMDQAGEIPIRKGEEIPAGRRVFDGDGHQVITSHSPDFRDVARSVEDDAEYLWEGLSGIMLDHVATLTGRRAFHGDDRIFPELTDAQNAFRAATTDMPDSAHRAWFGHHTDWEGVDPPSQVLGPTLVSETRQSLFRRGVNFGFERIISPIIDAGIRTPMAAQAFHASMQTARNATKWLRDASLWEDQLPAIFDSVLQAAGVQVPADKAAADVRKAIEKHDPLALVELDNLDDEQVLVWAADYFRDPKVRDQFARGGTAAGRRAAQYPWWGVSLRNADDPIDALVSLYQQMLGRRLQGSYWTAMTNWEVINNVPIEMRQVLFPDTWNTLKAAIKNREIATDAAIGYAQQRAIVNGLQFIDSHEIRSQYGEYAKAFTPFWYAEENFLKRWGRTLVINPNTVRKGILLYSGLKSGGIVQTDENGKDWFIYPGSGVLTEVLGKIPGFQDVVPAGAVFGTDPLTMLPGFNPDQTGIPSAGPLLALGLDKVAAIFPELRELNSTIVGVPPTDPFGVSLFIPASWRRIYEAITQDEDTSRRYASAMMTAIQVLEANGKGLPEDATSLDIEKFLDRVRGSTRTIMMAQAMAGFIVPGSPAVQFTGDSNMELSHLLGIDVDLEPDMFRASYRRMVQSLGIEEGTIQYLKFHAEDPHSLTVEDMNRLAYGVSQSRTPSGAPLAADKATRQFWASNPTLFDQYPEAAAWLIPPHPQGESTFDQVQYNSQLISGLRVRRTPDQFLRAIMFKTAAMEYFDARDSYDRKRAELNAAGLTTERQRLDHVWDVWSSQFKSVHPIFAEELASNRGAQTREKIRDQLRLALQDTVTPDTEHTTNVRELMDAYDSYKIELQKARLSQSQSARQRVKQVQLLFSGWVDEFLLQHRELEPFWQTLLRPDASLTYIA